MNVNSDSGMLNTVSGKEGKVFRLNRNERSHWSGPVFSFFLFSNWNWCLRSAAAPAANKTCAKP